MPAEDTLSSSFCDPMLDESSTMATASELEQVSSKLEA